MVGEKYTKLKGLTETLFDLFGLDWPNEVKPADSPFFHRNRSLTLGEFGRVGEVAPELLSRMGITKPVTILGLDFAALVAHAKPTKKYIPIPKYPPIVEDLSFIVPEQFTIGPLMASLKAVHPLVADVRLIDVHEDSRTVRITYQDPQKNLTSEEIAPLREKLMSLVRDQFGLTIRAA